MQLLQAGIIFQSTRPARGATLEKTICICRFTDFNPRAPRGARPHCSAIALAMPGFQSTRPARGATLATNAVLCFALHFNPRAPRGARLFFWGIIGGEIIFQSTRPARGATLPFRLCFLDSSYFNPRAPRGARLDRHSFAGTLQQISIHAPREGRDKIKQVAHPSDHNFNPRAPRGARPRRAETQACGLNFNPRAPRGARQNLLFCKVFYHAKFQSTRPARGATAKVNKFLCTFLQKRHGFQIFLCKTLPFKALCRLQIGKNFSICGANRCGNFCELLLRTIRSSVLPEGRSACSQNAQFYSHTFSRDNRNADCLFPDP